MYITYNRNLYIGVMYIISCVIVVLYKKNFKINMTGSTYYVPLTEAVGVLGWVRDTPVSVTVTDDGKVIIEKVG